MKSEIKAEILAEAKQELRREDRVIPLNSFSVPGVDWEAIRDLFGLPEQYLRTCTLKEGTVITLAIYQIMCVGLMAFLGMLLIFFRKETSEWWWEKFRNDLDYYYQDENEEMRIKLHNLWEPLTYAVIEVHFAFFMTGWLVAYALLKKTAHPFFYLPWIIMSCTLCIINWLMCLTIMVVIGIFAFYRDISVTWDLVPICCIILYGIAWTYSNAVVIAHYKRRRIVQYWRNKADIIGSDSYPQEIKEYIYQYVKPR